MFSTIHARSVRANWLPGSSVIRWFGFVFLFALFTGCLDRKPKILGTEFDGNGVPVATARRSDAGSRLIVRGTMTEKCPEAGCWFMLRDESGVIKVDTKDAGFVVVDVPLQMSVTVAGRVGTNSVGERLLKATGLRY
jgi:uncharacterized protein YdeI (BOF family)